MAGNAIMAGSDAFEVYLLSGSQAVLTIGSQRLPILLRGR